MPRFDIYEASIEVDGVNLPEYNVTTDEETKTVTCWIPSEVEKCFVVNWEQSEPRSHLACSEITVDGSSVGGNVQDENECKRISKPGVATSLKTLRPFKFSSLELADDDDILDVRNVDGLGNIELEIWEVEETDEDDNEDQFSLALDDHAGKIHERSKKSMTQQVKFGDEIPINIEWEYCKELDYIQLLVTFIFKYRSIGILRAERIVPADLKTYGTKGKRKIDNISDTSQRGSLGGATKCEEENNLDSEEEEMAEKRLKALHEEIKSIEEKLAKKSSKPSARKKIKTELCSSLISGEVIDLTLL
ncbi:hypothetical protein Hypma_014895 [Hypsizygus marmoreus]|uniref:DUF7918 domain-containing protein n=1 Tax=Hypsizygus marmoreus TaxID=39966 RepID=A0A369K1A0_HYPMA|nr:hypothetical protein Hypma_014895 [Hypsizygus marmoreus]